MTEFSRNDLLAEVATLMISLRTERGHTLEAAAHLAHLDPERLAQAEAGEIALDENELQNLADAYDVSITAFFGGKVTPVAYLFGA
ncbi:MAG TPA: helix-turn-helix transcriptional regulator [Candidatus Baltobacteraceae bacterium]|nr:helix-turn-helix transcriptional regulator [Candidatus Baltobacteraceae bacterium]